MKTKSLLLLTGITVVSLSSGISCSKPDSGNVNSRTLVLPNTPFEYSNTTAAKGQLGRVLFYDKSLSVNNSVSCGTCHLQSLAFADNERFSRGFENVTTSRNTPPIQNLSELGQALFWDGRERLINNMVMQPIFNHVEMGMKNPSDVVKKVKSMSYYEPLFNAAFGSPEITFPKIAEALGGFTSSITADQSKFDRSIANFNGINFGTQLSAEEEAGFKLFFEKYNCGSCHNVFSPKGYNGGGDIIDPLLPPNTGFADELVNIGLDANYTDNGRGDLTNDAEDNGKFKIPNLRNVALTAPYMHDGRFNTLDEVIEHYNKSIKNHPNLDFRLRDENGKPKVMNISEGEKRLIIKFLHTLTDNSLLTDAKFSDPFKKN